MFVFIEKWILFYFFCIFSYNYIVYIFVFILWWKLLSKLSKEVFCEFFNCKGDWLVGWGVNLSYDLVFRWGFILDVIKGYFLSYNVNIFYELEFFK